jgi:hydroxypyruvate isomerase
VPRLAANLSLLFTQVPFLDRFQAAAEAGFAGVEFMFPYDHEPAEVADRAAAAGVAIALFNCSAGDWAAGERGIAALPDRVAECRAGIDRGILYARALACPRLHLMAGKLAPTADRGPASETLVGNIRYAADAAAVHGIEIMLEPINTRVDIPGYYYDRSSQALDIADRVDRANVKLQFDIYHMQIMEGDLARSIERHLPRIGHIQLADNPGRHEPGTGEINFAWLLPRLDSLGYAGWVGCEYVPAGDTAAGLGWAAPYLTDRSRA